MVFHLTEEIVTTSFVLIGASCGSNRARASLLRKDSLQFIAATKNSAAAAIQNSWLPVNRFLIFISYPNIFITHILNKYKLLYKRKTTLLRVVFLYLNVLYFVPFIRSVTLKL